MSILVCAVMSYMTEQVMEMIFYLCLIGIVVTFIMMGCMALKGILLELRGATEEEYADFIGEVTGKRTEG